jgi:hypothetical protein
MDLSLKFPGLFRLLAVDWRDHRQSRPDPRVTPLSKLLILHLAQDSPELRALAPDWPSHVANYEGMLSG